MMPHGAPALSEHCLVAASIAGVSTLASSQPAPAWTTPTKVVPDAAAASLPWFHWELHWESFLTENHHIRRHKHISYHQLPPYATAPSFSPSSLALPSNFLVCSFPAFKEPFALGAQLTLNSEPLSRA